MSLKTFCVHIWDWLATNVRQKVDTALQELKHLVESFLPIVPFGTVPLLLAPVTFSYAGCTLHVFFTLEMATYVSA